MGFARFSDTNPNSLMRSPKPRVMISGVKDVERNLFIKQEKEENTPTNLYSTRCQQNSESTDLVGTYTNGRVKIQMTIDASLVLKVLRGFWCSLYFGSLFVTWNSNAFSPLCYLLCFINSIGRLVCRAALDNPNGT